MDEFTILISDRNRNVRELLKREMSAEGYLIRMAKNGMEVLEWLYENEPLDLLIVDPELPGMAELDILEKIKGRVPSLPIIMHAFSEDCMEYHHASDLVFFVEKKGNSVDRLKQVVSNLLKKPVFVKRPTALTNGTG